MRYDGGAPAPWQKRHSPCSARSGRPSQSAAAENPMFQITAKRSGRVALSLAAFASAALALPVAAAEPTKVKVFIGAMFEIGENTGDRAGEFQHWYERYW